MKTAGMPGCTEIALLIQQEHKSVPLYDTAQIYAAQAVKLAIKWIKFGAQYTLYNSVSSSIMRHLKSEQFA